MEEGGGDLHLVNVSGALETAWASAGPAMSIAR